MKAGSIIKQAEHCLKEQFNHFEEIAYKNQIRVLEAFKHYQVRDHHFNGSTGYGYGDTGRMILEKLYADVFQAHDALVRQQIVSGTHAISACLFALLRPGDELVSVTGPPYDTLRKIIGSNKTKGGLVEKGILYREVALRKDGLPDPVQLLNAVGTDTRMVFMQRSRGYSLRPALTISAMKDYIALVKAQNPYCIIMVDNCYGEFTDTIEPCAVGADLAAGSLIKNPGGGLAPTGGYIVGKKDLVEEVAFYMTAPGLGRELGSSLVDKRWFYQGLFMAPHCVSQALKGAVLLARVLADAGYQVEPAWHDVRADIIQAVCFPDLIQLRRFCQLIQSCSPVDSNVTLEFSSLPGYDDPVIMAAGTFVQGASLELSCDAPGREPYYAFVQGGLTYEHYRYTIETIVNTLILEQNKQ